ncbi:hypothetical protein, conserved [Eimeria tenella]|uniref:AP2-coincident C-terminal domain-containing protein n=1 Tax=Eimeria tenella TaxID=5802 RepID=U6L0V7_EIMTE|nr:hypothetical protein, conserved [Eimeria tenella]CDJ42224.1 hypothetical protein, conserved [Eimeria tenella]|eukprot:XP_013232974.1 hypothetical protein, conserved [Eimeria tenella]
MVAAGRPPLCKSKRREPAAAAAEMREERLARDLAILELSRRVMSARTRTAQSVPSSAGREAEEAAANKEALEWSRPAHQPLEEDGYSSSNTISPEDFAAAYERRRARRASQQQQGEGRQQQQPSFSSADTAAMLSSAVDLSGLRDGLQTTSSSSSSRSEASKPASSTLSLGPSSRPSSAQALSFAARGGAQPAGGRPEAAAAAAEAASRGAGEQQQQQRRCGGGQDFSELQSLLAEFAATERPEFTAANGGMFSGAAAASSKEASHPSGGGAGEFEAAASKTELQGEDTVSTSLFSRLIQECQLSGCVDFDLNSADQAAAARGTGELAGRLPALSAELVALLQHHQQLSGLGEKQENGKRLLTSANSTACNSNINSRRTSNCSPGAEDDGSEETRAYKRRIIEMHLLDQRRSSFASVSSSSGSSELRLLAASLAGGGRDGEGDPAEGGAAASAAAAAAAAAAGTLAERKPKQQTCPESGGAAAAESPSNPSSPSYLAELQLIERVAGGDPFVNEEALGPSAFRGPLGYYSVCEAAGKEEASSQRLYPIVRGVSRDNTKKRWAVYWKGYRRYFYDKFFESCVEAYKRAVHFRQQATTAAAAVTATGNPAHLIAAGLHGSPGSSSSSAKHQLKADHSECVAAVLASAAAAVANQASGESRKGKASTPCAGQNSSRDDRTVVCLYKEAILFILEDLRNNVLAQYLTAKAAASSAAAAAAAAAAPSSAVELAAATTAKRLMDQTLLMHTNLVGNATSTAELQPSLMIVAPCLEELKLPSQLAAQQQLALIQSILAMHIQQLVLLSRYLNKGDAPPLASDAGSPAGQPKLASLKSEAEQGGPPAAAAAPQHPRQQQPPAAAGGALDVPA